MLALDYPIIDERIKTRSLEVHITDHCNLTCDQCCSLSPLLDKHFVKVEEMQRDLQLATRVVAPTYIKLVGGEPLLHPDIIECLKVARPMAQILSVTTNALLLAKMDDEFWQLIDGLTISIYPKPKLPEKLRQLIEHNAQQFNVRLNIKQQDNFVQMTLTQRSEDDIGIQAIYDDCWLRERCHIVDKGRFYSCTRPPHFASFFKGDTNHIEEGVLLHQGPLLRDEILQHLLRSAPFNACFYCKGGSAEEAPHRLLNAQQVLNVKASYR